MIRTALRLSLFAGATLWFFGFATRAAAQSGWPEANPCGTNSAWSATPLETGTMFGANRSEQPAAANGLMPANYGAIVYDSNQGVCWLADANLAGHPEVRAAVQLSPLNPDNSVPVINPDGTMNYQTARNWVNSLNNYNGGNGWLGHHDWQLPTNPLDDATCSSFNKGNFGAECTGSALGNLYNVGLAETYPASVVPDFLDLVWPFFNLQPGLYWAADANGGGEITFSFNTGINGANTTTYNLLHVLPMTKTVLGPVPVGKGILPYLFGPAAGKAVYDTATGVSWTFNANLPAFNNFGVTGTASILPDANPNTNRNTLTVPLVDSDGAVYLSAWVSPVKCTGGGKTSGLTSEWIIAMNSGAGYAGTNDWQLPCLSDLTSLYNDMTIIAGDPRLEWPFTVGPFWSLQPGFYWACPRATGAGSSGPCDFTQNAPQGLEWSFNFDDGFEGTDFPDKQFYVLVYFPAP